MASATPTEIGTFAIYPTADLRVIPEAADTNWIKIPMCPKPYFKPGVDEFPNHGGRTKWLGPPNALFTWATLFTEWFELIYFAYSKAKVQRPLVAGRNPVAANGRGFICYPNLYGQLEISTGVIQPPTGTPNGESHQDVTLVVAKLGLHLMRPLPLAVAESNPSVAFELGQCYRIGKASNHLTVPDANKGYILGTGETRNGTAGGIP